jgi:hypothetical protein
MGFFSGILDSVKSVTGAIGDVLDPVEGLLSAGSSLLGASSANSANRDIANRQMAFQADMSNTSYQRAVADMEKAGLNPMLAYGQGGASTPSGASATMQDVATPAVNSGLAAQKNNAEVQNLRETNNQIKSSTALNLASAAKAKADATLSTASAAKAIADTDLSKATTSKTTASTSETNFWSDLYKTARSYTQPASSAVSNKTSGGIADYIPDFLKKPQYRKH